MLTAYATADQSRSIKQLHVCYYFMGIRLNNVVGVVEMVEMAKTDIKLFVYKHTYSPCTVSSKNSSCFFSVQQNTMEGKRKCNRNGPESLTFCSCNSLEPQMQYLVFSSTYPYLPLMVKTFRTSYIYLVLLFGYSGNVCDLSMPRTI